MSRSESHSLEVAKAFRQLLFNERRFVFDEVPFYARLFCCAKERGQIDLAGAECDVICDVGAARERTCFDAFAHVFQVHQLPSFAVLLEEFDRVLRGVNDPENVHFECDMFWVGFAHHSVEQRFCSLRLEFIPVDVVEELYAMFRKDVAGAIEDLDGLAAFGVVEVSIMRDPCAACVFQAERLCFAGDGFWIIPVLFIREMACDGFQAVVKQEVSELFCFESVGSGQFDVPESQCAHFGDGAGHIVLERVTQAVELKAYRSFETGANTGPWVLAVCGDRQIGRTYGRDQSGHDDELWGHLFHMFFAQA